MAGGLLPASRPLPMLGFCSQTTTNLWKRNSASPGFIILTYLIDLLSYSVTELGILGEEMVRERTSPCHRSVSVIPGWGPREGSVLSTLCNMVISMSLILSGPQCPLCERAERLHLGPIRGHVMSRLGERECFEFFGMKR